MSLIPGVGVAEGIASVVTKRAQNHEAAREGDLALQSHDIRVQEALIDHATQNGDAEALVTHSEHRTAQVSAAEQTKQSKERTKRVAIAAGAGFMALVLTVGGGLGYYIAKRSGDAVDSVGKGLSDVGSGIKTMFTEQEVSAAEIQNVANYFTLPGKSIVEETGLNGSIDVQTQGQFLGIQNGQSTDIPATVCGAEQLVVDLNNPGVVLGADQLSNGHKEITLQVPVDAINAQFVPGTTFGSDGTLLSQCENQAPTNGFFTKVGATSQEKVSLYEQASLESNCVTPALSLLDEGIRNSVRGTFKFGSMGRSAVDKLLKSTPAEQAKDLYIQNLLSSLDIKIQYVEASRVSDASGLQSYTPVDINTFRFGLPTQPNKNQLANALGEDPSHVSIPTQDQTQCLMTAVGSDTYQKIKSNPQQILNQTAPTGASN